MVSVAKADPVVAHNYNMGTTRVQVGTKTKIQHATSMVGVVDTGNAGKGLAFAQSVCSSCHNVLRTEDLSPNNEAPTFKEIANTPGMSITALTVWSRTSHPTMPNLVISPNDMDDLIAYILSLRDR